MTALVLLLPASRSGTIQHIIGSPSNAVPFDHLTQVRQRPYCITLAHGNGTDSMSLRGASCAGQGLQEKFHLDNDVGHVHLSADGWQPDDQLNGVHIVGDDHQLGLPCLHKVCDVVQTKLHHHRLLFV